ncbi:MAG TPA: X2-like carbohydrate binding domain-containing protein, partial [Clostridia bacterium]
NVPEGLTGVNAISAYGSYTLALKDDRTIAAWGDNEYDQCTIPAGLTGVKAVSAGYDHAVALKEDGTVTAWGDNYYDQCKIPAGLTGVKAISAGGAHTVVLKQDGTAVAWGGNGFGQSNIPANLTGEKAIATGFDHTVVLKEGAITAWGDNSYGQCDIPTSLTGVKAVSAGDCFTAALKEDGTVVAWGDNEDSQCALPAGLTGVKAIAAGGMHTAALKEDGTVVTWGNNEYDQCMVPAGLTGVKAIAAGEYHTAALKEDGTVVAWGNNEYGQCTLPTDLIGVKAIAAGEYCTIALKEDGTIVAWGDNEYGQCTIPDGLSGVNAIAAGFVHAAALKQDGTVVAWGNDSNGDFTVQTGLSGIKAIAAGGYQTVALKEDGSIVGFGGTNFLIPAIKTELNTTNSITPSTAGFYISHPNDISVNIGENSGKLLAIKNGPASLTSSDYSVSGNTVTIKKSYLSYYFNKFNSPGQKLNLIFDFDSGNDPALTVSRSTVLNFITCDNPAFDSANPQDITVNITGAAIQGLKNGSASLTSSDCSISGNTVTIKKSYLTYFFNKFNTPDQKLNLTFDFNSGNDPILTISRAAVSNFITCDNPAFDSANPQDITVNITGAAIQGLKNGSASLTSSDCSVSGNLVTIKKSYLTYFFNKFNTPDQKLNLTFDFDSGNDPILTVSRAVVSNFITCNNPAFDSANPQDITVNVTGAAIQWLKNGSTSLTSSDYSVSGNMVTIKKSYLTYFFNKFNTPDQKLNLTFDFDSGNDSILTISRAVVSNYITCNNPAFDLKNPQDITISITGTTLSAIKNGPASLTSIDYSVSGSTVIIKKGYLIYFFSKFNSSGQKLNLTFDFDSGNDPALTVLSTAATNTTHVNN